MNYQVEKLGEEEDDGTIVSNAAELEGHVVGRKIVRAQKVKRTVKSTYSDYTYEVERFEIELDNGKTVSLTDSGDCCAFTELESFLLNAQNIDHAITGVGTTDGYTKWHIYADLGDVLELSVGWSCGNPFYYGYGFDITVEES